MGIGCKTYNGQPTKDLCVKFYVDQKLQAFKDLIPPQVMVQDLGLVMTKVEKIGSVELESLKIRVRPVLGGYSIGHESGGCGSKGCLVRKRGDRDKMFILSAGHVLDPSGTASRDDAILQPGVNDGGAIHSDTVANFYESVPLHFSPVFAKNVDAAIAGPIDPANCSHIIAEIQVAPSGVATPLLGMQVHKVGKSTGLTSGEIKATRVSLRIPYEQPVSNTLLGIQNFNNLVECSRYSKGGDSGSIILDRLNNAIGLHIAAEGNKSFFIPIQDVLDALDIELVTDVS
jgi:hypothetical protein